MSSLLLGHRTYTGAKVGIKLKARPSILTVTFSQSTEDLAHADRVGRVLPKTG